MSEASSYYGEPYPDEREAEEGRQGGTGCDGSAMDSVTPSMTDELAYLRGLQQQILHTITYHRDIKYSELACELAELREMVNQRIGKLAGTCGAVMDSGGPHDVTCGRNAGHDGVHLT